MSDLKYMNDGTVRYPPKYHYINIHFYPDEIKEEVKFLPDIEKWETAMEGLYKSKEREIILYPSYTYFSPKLTISEDYQYRITLKKYEADTYVSGGIYTSINNDSEYYLSEDYQYRITLKKYEADTYVSGGIYTSINNDSEYYLLSCLTLYEENNSEFPLLSSVTEKGTIFYTFVLNDLGIERVKVRILSGKGV